MIFVPKTRSIEIATEMPKHLVRGFFKLEAFQPGRYRRVVAPWFPNLVLTGGLNRMGTLSFIAAAQVGTGNATPLVTDNNLQTYLAGSTTQQSSDSGVSGSAPYYGYQTVTYRFGAGVAAGNLAEVGVGAQLATGNLFSRALILDGFGAPTTVTVLPDEFLDVTYQLRCYAPDTTTSYNVDISGVTYAVQTRASLVTNSTYWVPKFSPVGAYSFGLGYHFEYNGSIGAVTSSPSGTSALSSSVTNQSYSNNSLQRDMLWSAGLNEANLAGGVKSVVMLTTLGTFQTEFTPAIPKDSTKVLSLLHRVAWGAYTPGSP